MKLFVVNIRFTLLKDDVKYIVKNYAVMAETEADAYQIIMNKHLDKRHFIIDINTESATEDWIPLFPDTELELERTYAERSEAIKKWEENQQDITWRYMPLIIMGAYLIIALLIVIGTSQTVSL